MKNASQRSKMFSIILSIAIMLAALGVVPASAGELNVTQLSDPSVYPSVSDAASVTPDGLPAYRGGKHVSTNKGLYGLVTYTVQETTAAQYVSYLKSMEADGWEQYSNNMIQGDNLFATYTKSGGSAYIYYIGSKHIAYIAVSPYQNLENREEDNDYEKITTPQLTQVKLLYSEVSEGMSYILRLSDGRFIIIDGGWNEANYYEATQLYRRLVAQNELDEITIAAWFVTHPHGDHLGTINDFLKRYAGKVSIEEMVFQFPTDDIYAKSNEAYLATDMHSARVQTFFKNLETYWPDMKIVTSHTGQKYHIADATIEILHTLEDYFPKTIDQNGEHSINSISMLFSVEIAGQRIMFTGDLDRNGSADAVAMWGSYLKSDMVQMSHHGLMGATVELYQAISPTVALLPASMPHYQQALSNEASKYLLKGTCPTVREVIVSNFMERTLELPYESNSSVLIPNRPKKIYTYTEPEHSSGDVPEPYMDLSFNGEDVYDAAGNTEMTMKGGRIDTNTVIYHGNTYTIPSYRAEKAGEYVDVLLPGINSAEELGEFLLSGCTFEMFVALDEMPTATSGFLTSCNAGGVSLYLRSSGGLSFQIGNSVQDGKYPGLGYSYVTNDVTTYRIFADTNVTHVLGTYDPEDNTLNLYLNGVRIYKTDYGTPSFNIGKAIYNHLGIGLNVSYPSETLGAQTPYTVIRSRVYDTCLTDAQVASEYWDCIDTMIEDSRKLSPAKPDEPDEPDEPGAPTEDEKTAEGGCRSMIVSPASALLLISGVVAGASLTTRRKKEEIRSK